MGEEKTMYSQVRSKGCYNEGVEGKIPQNVMVFLWDVHASEISLKKHATFIIERILEYGDFKEILWLNQNFDVDQIRQTLIKSRRISPKTGSFYSMVYKLSRDELCCIQRPFTRKQERF